MNPIHAHPRAGPRWSTAVFGEAAEASPRELSLLEEHLQVCRARCGRWFVLGWAAESTQAFVAARIVTTLVVLALLAGLGVLAW